MRYGHFSLVNESFYGLFTIQDKLLAAPLTDKAAFEDLKEEKPNTPRPRRFAGHKRIGEHRPALEIARGALVPDTQRSKKRNRIIYSTENALTHGVKLL